MSSEKSVSNTDVSAVRSYWEDIDVHVSEGLAPHEREIFPRLYRIAAVADSVLEIGTAAGRWIDSLREAGVTEPTYYGLDITDAIYDADCEGLKADTRRLPLNDDVFDATFSIGVIEHFPESSKAIAEHVRVTAPGGWVFLITPKLSPLTLRRYVTYYLRGEHKRGTFEQIRGRNLTRRWLERTFENAGLEAVETGGYGDVWLPVVSQHSKVQRVLQRVVGDSCASFVFAQGRVPE